MHVKCRVQPSALAKEHQESKTGGPYNTGSGWGGGGGGGGGHRSHLPCPIEKKHSFLHVYSSQFSPDQPS